MNKNRNTILIIACIVIVYLIALNAIINGKLNSPVVRGDQAPGGEVPDAQAGAADGGSTEPESKPEPDPEPEPEPEPEPQGITGELAIGNVVTYGSYEQDNDFTNGREPLQWDVIGQSGDKYLLITHYVIDGHRFSDNTSDNAILATDNKKTANQITWAKSGIRRWLNGEFYDIAFEGFDTSRILRSHLTTADFIDNAVYVDEAYSGFSDSELKKMDAVGGDATDDYVFLLSVEEIAEYYQPVRSRFPIKRQCGATIVSPTDYAKEMGVEAKAFSSAFKNPGGSGYSPYYTDELQPDVDPDYEENGFVCSWLTRSPGVYAGGTAVITVESGYVCFDPAASKNEVQGVRPAIWVQG